jgi:hypothetical protein
MGTWPPLPTRDLVMADTMSTFGSAEMEAAARVLVNQSRAHNCWTWVARRLFEDSWAPDDLAARGYAERWKAADGSDGDWFRLTPAGAARAMKWQMPPHDAREWACPTCGSDALWAHANWCPEHGQPVNRVTAQPKTPRLRAMDL